MPLHTIRNICLFGLPLLLSLAACLHLIPQSYSQQSTTWNEYFYIISLTANIGYFTNFIAIKMLFKPYQKTALGIQGLIPKNQSKLANALSSTLTEHFLSSEHWLEYIQQVQLIPKTINLVQNYCYNWLQQPKSLQQLNQFIRELLEQNKEALNQLFTQFQQQIIHEISDNLEPKQLLEHGFGWIETQFIENPKKMEFLIEPIINTIAGNIPLIAQHLMATFDTHIEKQDTIKRSIARAARWSANISEDDIRNYLFRIVASTQFRQTLLEGLHTLISEYKHRNQNTPPNNLDFNFDKLINQFIQNQTNQIDLIQIITDKMQEATQRSDFKKTLIQLVNPVFSWLETQLTKPDIENVIHKKIIQLIEHIDLREVVKEKANKFSPKKMEQIFHSMIKDQLVFIELLGALLGALSGLVLINPNLFSLITAIVIGIYFIDIWLSRKKIKTE
ncbi:DUF445 domain-containing protein [Aliikangiella sp. IMCC44359]|uniref:DUF445 domain-containing protein n=1 Tax=Aliikangiella sp. IMCC44359 TaxID=3459125 RepID=UPI00403AC9F0